MAARVRPWNTPAGVAGLVLGVLAAGGFAALLMAGKPWESGVGDPGRALAGDYGWWAGLGNSLLLAFLAVSAKWWAVPVNCPTAGVAGSPPPVRRPAWFRPLVAGAVLLCAAFGLARIGGSLSETEDAAVRQVIHGEWKMREDGSPAFRKPAWADTLFQSRANHLQTILSRMVDETWMAAAKPSGLRLSEVAMRTPVLLAAVVSVMAVAGLLGRIGLPRAGVAAAYLTALHPLHVRYAVELSGHVFVMAFVPLLLWALLVAVGRGQWRDWVWFAGLGFLCIFSHPVAIPVVVVANICALGAVSRHKPRPGFLRAITPWAVATLLAAMLCAQFMLPSLPGLPEILPAIRSAGADAASGLFAGVPLENSDPSDAILRASGVHGVALWVALTAALGGFLRILFRRPLGWAVTAVFLAPAVLIFLPFPGMGNFSLWPVLLSALPGFLCCVACGLDVVAGSGVRLSRHAPPWVLGAGVLAFGLASQQARGWLLANPLIPLRESTLAIRPSLDPFNQAQNSVLTARFNAPAHSYDPRAFGITSMKIFLGLMQLADESGRTLFIVCGNLDDAADEYPAIYRMILDNRLFEKITEWPAPVPSFSRSIWKYRPGSLAGYE